MTTTPLDPVIEEAICRKSMEIAKNTNEQEHSLLPVEARAKQIENEIRRDCLEYQTTCITGMKYCMEYLQEVVLQEVAMNDLSRTLENIYVKLHDGFNSLKKSVAFNTSNDSTSKLMGLDDKTCMFLYKAAAKMLNENEYEKAAASFFLLVSLNHGWAVCWLCLGHAEFFLENYAFAASCYHNAYQLDDTSCLALILEAECYEKQKEYQQAITLLEEAKNKDEFTEVINERLITLKAKGSAL